MAASASNTRAAPRASSASARISVPLSITTLQFCSSDGSFSPSSTKQHSVASPSGVPQRARFTGEFSCMDGGMIDDQFVVHERLERAFIIWCQKRDGRAQSVQRFEDRFNPDAEMAGGVLRQDHQGIINENGSAFLIAVLGEKERQCRKGQSL